MHLPLWFSLCSLPPNSILVCLPIRWKSHLYVSLFYKNLQSHNLPWYLHCDQHSLYFLFIPSTWEYSLIFPIRRQPQCYISLFYTNLPSHKLPWYLLSPNQTFFNPIRLSISLEIKFSWFPPFSGLGMKQKPFNNQLLIDPTTFKHKNHIKSMRGEKFMDIQKNHRANRVPKEPLNKNR